MAILDPIKIVLQNYDGVELLDAPNHPMDKQRGTHKLPFSKILYIERSDFRLENDKDFFGLAPNKEVGLRYAYNIRCTNVVKDSRGDIVELHAEVDKLKANKPKGHIHWVAQPSPSIEPTRAEVRLYSHLFKSEDPALLTNWLEDINPDALVTLSNVFIDPYLAAAGVEDHFQFERVGFFVKDRDSTEALPVWNRTVPLKDAYHSKPKS